MNKKNQHLRAVETLGISGNGDELTLAKIDKLIHNRQLGQPYSRNVLIRIQDVIERYLKEHPND